MENSLSHHGIKGMKWGVRRYRNKDGSLTPAGKKRQSVLDAKAARDRSAKAYNEASKNYKRDINAYEKAKKDAIPKSVKVGAALAATALAVYGGYKVNKFLNECTYSVNGKNVSRKEFTSTINTVIKNTPKPTARSIYESHKLNPYDYL